MELFIILCILVPATTLAIIGMTVHMRKRSRKLLQDLQSRGLLVYTVPVVAVQDVNTFMGHNNHQQLRSPANGLPPPPPYTSTQSTAYSETTPIQYESAPPYSIAMQENYQPPVASMQSQVPPYFPTPKVTQL